MKYCYYKTYFHGTPPPGFDKEYNVPIICDDTIYNQVPMDNQSLTIKSASLEGYDTVADVLDSYTDALGFFPAVSEFFLGSDAYNHVDSDFDHIASDLFIGVVRAQNPFDMWVYYGIEPTGYAYDVAAGDVELGGLNATNGFTVLGLNKAPYFSGYQVYRRAFPNGMHYECQFDVFPEAFIDSGSFFSNALHAAADPAATYSRRYCRVTVSAWFDENLHKYNYFIELRGFDRDITALQSYFDGKDTGNIYDPKDPTNNNQNDQNQGGDGDGIPKSDNIPVPELPDSDMTSSGSIAVYNPTSQEIKDLFDYLHSAQIGDAIVKLWQNPIQSIVSLHYLPYPMQIIGDAKVSVNMVGLATGVMSWRAKQFQTIYFGHAKVETSKQNAYTDRAPYTKCQIFLPGIGMREISIDDVMGKYVHVKYNCDNVSGQCVAFIVVGSSPNIDDPSCSVRYSYSGSLAAPFPISQSNWGQTYVAAATLAAGALALGVTAAAGWSTAAAGMAGTGGYLSAGVAAAGGSGAIASSAISMGSSAAQLMKPTVSRSGTVSGTTSLFSVRKPYLVIERPNIQDYAEFNKIRGYACGKTYKLGNLKGYTEVESIHLNGIPATADELQEILNLLKSGVIL